MKPSITSLFVLLLAVFSPTRVRAQEAVYSPPLQKSWLLKAHKQPDQANVATLAVRAGQVVRVQLSASYHRPSLLKRLPLALGAAVITSQLGKTNPHPEVKTAQAPSLTWPLLSASAVLAPAVLKSLRGVPKAYAQLRLYDQHGLLLSQQTRLLTKEARKGQLLAFQLPVAQEGFAQLQLVNESKQEVGFEQISITAHTEQNPNASARQAVVPKDSLPQGDGATAQAGTLATTYIPVKPGGEGTFSQPWEVAGGLSSIQGLVPANNCSPMGNDIYKVSRAGIYQGYYVKPGFYRNPQATLPPAPVTVTSGNGSNDKPYFLPEFVVRGNVPASNYTDFGGGLFLIQAGWYTNPNPGGGTPIKSYYPSGYYRIGKPPVDPEKDSKLYSNPCEGYKAMWNQSFKSGTAYKEVSAWITDKGILVLPMGNNTNKTSQSGPFDMDLQTKQYSVTLNGIEYRILGYIHTHPNTGVNPATGMTWQEPPSSEDYALLQNYGIPTYTIGTNNIYKSTLTNDQKTYDTLTSKTNLLNCSYQIGK